MRQRRRSRTFPPVTLALVALAIVLGPPASWVAVRGQVVFRSSVDLIAIDVQVLDRDGRPVTTLGPESFEVTVNGQKRRVQWAVFTRYDATAMTVETTTAQPRVGVAGQPPASPGFTAEPGRTIIIAIDAGSFRGLDSRPAVLAAQRFIDGLMPTDDVGLFTVPFGQRVGPTVDHAAVWHAVSAVVGQKHSVRGAIELTPAEVIDIIAAAETQPRFLLQDQIGRNRRSRFLTEDDQTLMDASIAKHCNQGEDAAQCLDRVVTEATMVASELETNALQSIAGLEDLLTLLQKAPGRKHVLLLSGGMPLSDRGIGRPNVGTALKRMGERAAYANTTVHAMYFDRNLDEDFSAESRRAAPSSIRSQAIDVNALAEFSAPSGGLLLISQTGSGEREVDRLLTETSTSYVLGVEPAERDRDGRPHRIQVKVNQQGAEVRSRKIVVVPRRPEP